MHSQNGITFIEILAASVILSIVVIGYMTYANYTSLSSQRTDHQVTALKIAEEELNISRNNLTQWILPSPSKQQSIYTITQQLHPMNQSPRRAETNRYVYVQSIVPVSVSSGSPPTPYLLTVMVEWP